MALFQQSVLKKFLSELDKDALEKSWNSFTAHFHHAEIQKNILHAKEEEYQGGFVDDLFVKVLGYTLYPQPNYNFVLEKKTETDSTKSDGAILDGEKVTAIIELKDTSTTDLDKVEKQAFGYKHRHKDCSYVITSNFQKLRFYISDATDHEEFDLFTLHKDRFAVLYLCLQQQHIVKNIPLQIKQASVTQEEQVTKKLYADYSSFRKKLFHNIVALNPQHDKVELFKRTQKLLDRFLFILFAEDRSLVPANSVRKILDDWKKLQELDAAQPLYDRFKLYFGFLNTGRDKTNNKEEIFAYNGGLFAKDEILDSLKIDDNILFESSDALSKYDFQTEVDVNILGHIFEHSLTEIEELQAEAEGKTIDKAKTKRKKDGVFYTPRYITKYIVENTIGALCKQKREELQLYEEDYAPVKKKKDQKVLLNKLNDYRNWLLQLTICDPACGSGAFLNQALEFLIAEHRLIDELDARLGNHSIIYSDVEKSILENNLYGVDINEEAVEIARLSLWLRTAQKGRKLSSLNENIKCGNSLIDDPAIAGDKAFNWQKEFEDVFKKGGFDVVIGNPPYLRVQGLRENFEQESLFFESNFKTTTGRFDIYVLFIEKSLDLINENGSSSFILPHKFMVSDFGAGIRGFLIENKALQSIISFGSEMVFEDASTYTCIIKCSKNNKEILYKQINPAELFNLIQFDRVAYSSLSGEKWNLQGVEGSQLFQKLNKQPFKAKDVFESISQGIVSVGDDIFIMQGKFSGHKFIGFSEKADAYVEIEATLMKPLLKGDDVKKYSAPSVNYYVVYPHYNKNGKTVPYDEDDLKEKFPLAYSYFLPYKNELINKKIKYKTNPKFWYSLHRSREITLFEQEKIITPETSLGTNLTIDTSYAYHNTQVYSFIKQKNISIDYKVLLCILNSSILWYYVKNTGNVLRGGFFRFKTAVLETFPIPNHNVIDQLSFIAKADIMLSKNKELHELKQKFLQLLQTNFTTLQVNKKLEQWPTLSAAEFLKELTKQKIKLTLAQQEEWIPYFEEQKNKAASLQNIIDTTDKEIDKMVYQLYELTEEEIAVIEAS